MSEFKVGDFVAFDRHLQANSVEYCGHWTVQSVHGDAVVISRDGDRPWYAMSRWLELVPPEPSRMIFPFEEPPEDEPDGLIGRPMVVDFADGRRSVGTLTGVGPVAYDGDDVVSYEVSYRQDRVLYPRTHGQTPMPVDPMVSEWLQPLRFQRRPVVHRASSGLRQPAKFHPAVKRIQGIINDLEAMGVL